MENKKILICDDDEDIIEITCLLLSKSGFRVEATTDSSRLHELIASAPPDLLLLDLWMPGLTGDQIVKSLRRDQHYQHLPVVVFSASQEGRDVAVKAGADAFIQKPFDIKELIITINKHLTGSNTNA